MALATALFMLVAITPAPVQARPGLLDRSFGVHGKLTRVINRDSEGHLPVTSFALGPGGKILVEVGSSVLRYQQDGKLDRSFGHDGRVTVKKSAGSQFEPTGFAVDSNGRVILAGTTRPFPTRLMLEPGLGGIAGPQPELATIFRFTAGGQPDPSFGTSGAVSTDFGFPAPIHRHSSYEESGAFEFHYEAPAVQVTGLAVDSEDRPVLTGVAVNLVNYCRSGSRPLHESFTARLTAAGMPDSTFGGTGVQAESSLYWARDPIIDPSGGVVYRIDAGDECEPDFSVTTLGRLDPAGSPGRSFMPDSSTATAAGVGSGGVFAVDRFGRILIEGIRESARYRRPKKNVDLVLRLHPNGSLDTRFGRNGTAGVRLAADTYFSAIAADSHGRVLRAGGRGTSACASCATKPGKGHISFALLRLRSNGKLDRRFGQDGRVFTSFGRKAEAFGSHVMIDHRGRILVAGMLFRKSPLSSVGNFTSVVSFALARYRVTRTLRFPIQTHRQAQGTLAR